MRRELTPWKFVINCLAASKEPLSIEEDFWKYTSVASTYIKNELPDIRIKDDHYSLEKVLWFNDPLINKEEGKISLNKKTIQKTIPNSDIDRFLIFINENLGTEVHSKLSLIFSKAYSFYASSCRRK